MSNPQADPFHHLHDEAYAQPYEHPAFTHVAMVAMGGRQTTPLAGDWNFTLDLFDEGLRQKWFADPPLPAGEWSQPRDYDAMSGDSVPVPGCWTVQRPEWKHYEGGAWYTRMIDGTPKPGEPRTVLRVGAANYQARVFLNGRFLGTHRGGSTPFFVELTRHLEPGTDNRLQIQVDNRRERHRVPMNHFDWFNHGGLYREVELLHLPLVFIRQAVLQLVPDTRFSQLRFEMALSDAVDGEAEIEIPALGLAWTVPVRAGRALATVEARPALWSPASPTLHDVVFRCVGDTVRERIGFREVRTAGTQVLLNGEPLYLKGICVHEDDEQLGKVSTEADVRRRLADAKALGCNFLRLSHYPHHEHVAQIADELGFLLWEEVPVYWAIQFDNPATLDDARNQLLELIHRDANRVWVTRTPTPTRATASCARWPKRHAEPTRRGWSARPA
jgi:beta-glucuronidase